MKKNFLLVIFSLFTLSLAQIPCDIPNPYIKSTDVFDRDVDKYKGITFLFYNILQYDNDNFEPPFPFQDGRVRSGKYKSSQTAMNNYLQGLSKYNGKRFSLVQLANEEEDMPGIVMACENGDTLLFNANIVDGQFVNETYLNEEKKDIGKTVYYLNNRSIRQMVNDKVKEDRAQAMRSGYAHFFGFTNLKTQKTIFYLPYLSKWRVVDVSYDTTFVGKRNTTNNEANATRFNRIRFVIESPDYGKYEYFLFNINDLNTVATRKDSTVAAKECSDNYNECLNEAFHEQSTCKSFRQVCEERILQPEWMYGFWENFDYARSFDPRFNQFDINTEYPEEDLQLIKEWASKGYIEAVYAKAIAIDKEKIYDHNTPKGILECAKKGYPPAIDQIVRKEMSKNVTGNQLVDMIFTAWKRYGGKQKKLDKLFEKTQYFYPRPTRNEIEMYSMADKYGYPDAKRMIKSAERSKVEEKNREEIEAVENEITEKQVSTQKGYEKILSKIQNLVKKYGNNYRYENDLEKMYKKTVKMRETFLNKKYKGLDLKNEKNVDAFFKEILEMYTAAVKYGHKDSEYKVESTKRSIEELSKQRNQKKNANKEIIGQLEQKKAKLKQKKKRLMQEGDSDWVQAEKDKIDREIEEIDKTIEKFQ